MKDRKRWRPSLADQAYPSLARWVRGYGWIEIGQDPANRSFVRALDEGGLVWEGNTMYPTLDGALRALDRALAKWLRDHLGE